MAVTRTHLYDTVRKGAERLSHKEVHAVVDALLANYDMAERDASDNTPPDTTPTDTHRFDTSRLGSAPHVWPESTSS